SWLGEARAAGAYLRAAQAAHDRQPDAARLAQGLDPKRLEKWAAALRVGKGSLDDPLHPWLALHPAARDAQDFAAEWKKVAERWHKEARERAEFNAKPFTSFGDFRTGRLDGWRADGRGLRRGATGPGDFTIASAGGEAISAVLPAGVFTHTLS